MKSQYIILTALIVILTGCNSSRVKESQPISFSSAPANCTPAQKISPDSVQGPKELFLPVSIQRAKEIVFDSSTQYGYRAPRIHKMSLKFNAGLRFADRRVKTTKRSDYKLKVLLRASQKGGTQGVIIRMEGRQVGGLSTYSYVSHILRTAHCLYTKIDFVPQSKVVVHKSGKKIILPANTIIPVRTTRTISSRVSKNGDKLEFIVLRNIRIKNTLVIAKGTRATGKVASLKTSKILGFSGKVGLSIDSVIATNGQKVALSFSKRKVAKNATGRTIAMGLAATPIFFMRGKEASIPATQEFNVQVSGKQILQY